MIINQWVMCSSHIMSLKKYFKKRVDKPKTFYYILNITDASDDSVQRRRKTLDGVHWPNLFCKNRKKIFIYNIKGNKMNKNFNIEFIAVAAERIAEFAERVFAIDNSVHRFK